MSNKNTYLVPVVRNAIFRHPFFSAWFPRPPMDMNSSPSIQTFGFIEGAAPPGMIYRHLRQMEEDNLLSSEWDTGETGAAKRIYTITDEGREVLEFWIHFMRSHRDKLDNFIQMYRDKQQN